MPTQLRARPSYSALDARGVVHFLIARTIDGVSKLDIVASNGEERHVLDGIVAGAKLVAAEPIGVVYVQQPVRNAQDPPQYLLRWDEGVAPTVLAEFDEQSVPAQLAVAPWGTAVSLDFRGVELSAVAPGALGLGPAAENLLFMTGGGASQRAWTSAAQTFQCAGQYTAYNPDVCSSKTRSATRGDSAPLGVHALASASDGSVWLARLSGSLETSCRWLSMNGCFETLPCDCREVSRNDYFLSLSLYRAPDFGAPVLVVDAPGHTQEASLVMTSKGDRLSIVAANFRQYASKVWWFDVNTALVPEN